MLKQRVQIQNKRVKLYYFGILNLIKNDKFSANVK
jgi:hypothetical protein